MWRVWSQFISYGNIQRTCGVARPVTLVAERNRSLPGTNNADDAIQNERYRCHWSGGHLNMIDQGVAKDYRDWLGNVPSLRDQR